MTRSQIVRIFFTLLLLGLLVTSAYVYKHSPRLLNQQLGNIAQQYGVHDIKFEGLQLSSSALYVDQLWLLGAHQDYLYEAALQSVQIQFDWRSLSIGRMKSVSIESLELALEQHASPSDTEALILDIASLHPQNIANQLPLNGLHIKQIALDYRSPGLPPLPVSGQLQITGNVDLQLSTTLGGSEITATLQTHENLTNLDVEMMQHEGAHARQFTSLSAQMRRASEDRWQWQLQGEWDDAAFLAWLHRLVLQPLPALDIANLENLTLEGSTRLTATVNHPDTLRFPITRELPLLAQVDATLHLAQSVERLDYAESIEGLTGAFDVTLMLENGQVELTAKPFEFTGNLATALLTLPQETQKWLKLKEWNAFNWSSSQSLRITSDNDGDWRGQLHGNAIALGDSDTQLNLQELGLTVSLSTGDALELRTSVRTRINTRLRKQNLPSLALDFSQQGLLDDSAYRLALGDLTESASIISQGNLDFTTGRGKHQVIAEVPKMATFTQLILPTLNQFGLLQSEMAISAGSAQWEVDLQTRTFVPAQWTQVSRLELQGLSGSISENHFHQFALEARWSGIEQWKTLRPIKLTLEKLESGFEIDGFAAQVSLPKPTPISQPALRIETLSARIFGGTMALSEAADWDFGAASNQLMLRVQQWQLAELVALQQDENIQASGQLEGELPVTLDAGRVIIDKGYLRALSPGGSIRYVANEASESLGESSSELAFALDLLSDFQYQTLSTEVELDKEGQLLLDLSLSGRNPSRFDGRQINFNINLEQNIDPLLQSLRVSDRLVEKIEHRLK